MSGDFDSDGMIDRFLDSELSEVEQEVLFSHLAADSQLRSEFSAACALRNTLKTQIDTPPAALKQRIFDAVQLPTTMPAELPMATGLAASSLVLRSSVLSALASCLLTSFFFLSNSSPFASTNQFYGAKEPGIANARGVEAQPELSTQNYSRLSNQNAPTMLSVPRSGRRDFGTSASAANGFFGNGSSRVRSTATLLRFTNRSSDLLARAKSSFDNVDSDRVTHQADVSLSSSADIDGKQAHSTVMPTESNDARSNSEVRVEVKENATNRDLATLGEQQSGTTARNEELYNECDLRAFAMMSFPDVQLGGLINPPLNNISLTYLRQLSAVHAVGLELGQESLLQHYTNLKAQSIEYIDQNYLAAWTALCYQYTPAWQTGILELQPFVRLSLGSTLLGPMSRAQLGLRKHLGSSLGLLLSVEGTSFYYKQNSERFSTQKVGLSAGLFLRF